MENKLSKRTHSFMPNSHPPFLAMHEDSQKISKTTKPKIRIIHIVAPEVIKTDVKNFREVVQRITGKASGGENHCNKKPTRIHAITIGGRDYQDSRRGIISNSCSKKMELKDINGGFGGLDQSRERAKKEEEVGLCSDASSGGYLGGFSDFEGFISELDQFALLPLDATYHTQGF